MSVWMPNNTETCNGIVRNRKNEQFFFHIIWSSRLLGNDNACIIRREKYVFRKCFAFKDENFWRISKLFLLTYACLYRNDWLGFYFILFYLYFPTKQNKTKNLIFKHSMRKRTCFIFFIIISQKWFLFACKSFILRGV